MKDLEKREADSVESSHGCGAHVQAIEQLESELAVLRTKNRALESESTHSRKTIDRLLADDLESSEENAQLRETIWRAHQYIEGVCACNVCKEVEQSRTELDGLWLNE